MDISTHLKVVIIDDEAKARRIMRMILDEYCDDITILAEVENVAEGVKAIQRYKPDLIFLDIDMPGYNGFQLLEFFDTIDFDIIFATAYSEYAIKAFQVAAVDYLLKPIQIDHVIAAIDKVRRYRNGSFIQQRVETLKTNMSEREVKRIALPLLDSNIFIAVKDVICLKAEGSYVLFYMNNGDKHLISKNIKDYETHLSPDLGFYRTHRSFLVNVNHIKKVNIDGGLLMTNDVQALVARERKTDFEVFMKQNIIL